MRKKSFLVACDQPVWSGGFIRFERIGRVLKERGHELSFVALTTRPEHVRTIDFPVFSLKEAAAREWDVTMIPGAGFPDSTMAQFSAFRSANFGIRVQHILNDQTRRDSFLVVNRSFAPHVVIFNNRHWTPGSYTEFQASRFHLLEGAVDAEHFQPQIQPSPNNRFTVGGLAKKNAAPLCEAIVNLPDTELHLFGSSPEQTPSVQALLDQGRLTVHGVIQEVDLPKFYHQLDCVVHTENFAGWANLGAEALASGIPLICTPHGTLAFAKDGESALVIPVANEASIRAAIQKLRSDAALRIQLTRNGRDAILPFSWEAYTDELLKLLDQDHLDIHYTHAPDWGMFGKWPIANRLSGLEPALNIAAGMNILDLGAAEGVIARAFFEKGAAFVHGVELDAARVARANELSSMYSSRLFETVDLSNWYAVAHMFQDHTYDIVLSLGLYHHLPKDTRKTTLIETVRLARKMFVIRTPDEVFRGEDLHRTILAEGFEEVAFNTGTDKMGSVRTFQRTT